MHEQYKILYTKQGLKDKKTAQQAGFGDKINSLLKLLALNPYEPYPPFEKLVGDLNGAFSRRNNSQHRLVYQVYKQEKVVKIISSWTHYE
ncbi:MAG: Txe/YoeB family addiction module toxin [Hyphomonadaceae bacterium]|nr:Txe/YoeB family addiction module toxin [Clostridia bacterium]